MHSELLSCSLFDLNKIIESVIRHSINSVISDQCDFSLYAQAVVVEVPPYQDHHPFQLMQLYSK